ncbi:MAG TPA: hypothetical protein HA263_07250 [Methanoregulaceae archaeon]|nr:hypothetical protein [Methanoregulaceae archaeon]
MKLFKTQEERRIERNIQVQKTLGLFASRIKKLRKEEQGYLNAALEAKRVGGAQQLELAKRAIKETLAQRRRLDHQLLTLKIAVQMKEQAESQASFAQALQNVSRTIADMFTSTNMVEVQKQFEMAMAKARSVEERVDLFLSNASTTMFGESLQADEIVTDAEIDRLIESEAAEAESSMDAQIDAGIDEIRRELAKDP